MEESTTKRCGMCDKEFATLTEGVEFCDECYLTEVDPLELAGDCQETRMYACKTCLRIVGDPVERCGVCEKRGGNVGIDPSELFQSVEAEAWLCQQGTDWESRLDRIEHIIHVLRRRIEKHHFSQLDEELRKESEVVKCTRQK